MTTPTAEVPLPTYATYFDVRLLATSDDLAHSRPDNWARRWQFVALPPSSRHRSDKLVMYHRAQDHRAHRAVWRSNTFREYSSMMDQYQAVLSEKITPSALAWIGPPIVVGLTPAEIDEYVIDRKTPWKVLERAGRQARKLGFRV